MMVPVGQLTVFRTAGRAGLYRAVAYLTWPALVAPVIAPVLGGVLATYASWRWIFLVNVPIGAVVLVAGGRLLERGTGARPPDLDVAGFGWTGAALGLLTWTSASLATGSASWVTVSSTGCASLIVLALAVAHLRRARHPLLDLRVLRFASMRIAFASGGLFRMAVTAVPFLLPLMFQDAFGWSPLKSGVVVLFVFIGNLAIKPATTPLLMRFGFRAVMLGASAGAAASMVGNGLLTAGTPIALTCALLVFGGMARSVGFTAYNTLAFADIPPGDLPAANTLSSTVQQVAVGFGVAIGAVALRAGDPVGRWTGLELPVAPYRIAFFLLAGLTLLPVVEAARAARSTGDALRAGRR
jgi:Major Facilitator Superfamily